MINQRIVLAMLEKSVYRLPRHQSCLFRSVTSNPLYTMPAKKTPTKTASKKAVSKKALKKASVKKAAKKAPAKKAVAKKSALSGEAVAKAAYLNYRRRMELGLPGDHATDWLEAERSVAKGNLP